MEIIIDENYNLKGCMDKGHPKRCYKCMWALKSMIRKHGYCNGKEQHKQLLIGVRHASNDR